jgi:hypothetical protein
MDEEWIKERKSNIYGGSVWYQDMRNKSKGNMK